MGFLTPDDLATRRGEELCRALQDCHQAFARTLGQLEMLRQAQASQTTQAPGKDRQSLLASYDGALQHPRQMGIRIKDLLADLCGPTSGPCPSEGAWGSPQAGRGGGPAAPAGLRPGTPHRSPRVPAPPSGPGVISGPPTESCFPPVAWHRPGAHGIGCRSSDCPPAAPACCRCGQ